MQASLRQCAVVGVDVSKSWLEFASDGDGGSRGRVANEPQALQRFLAGFAPGTIGMEATGGYHRRLAHLAHAAGWRVYVLNPLQVKRFRQSLGVRGKTDRHDAAAILRLLQQRRDELRLWAPVSAVQEELRGLLIERANRVKHATAFLANISCPQDKRQAQAFFATSLRQLEQRIVQLVRAEPRLSRAYDLLLTVPGIGPITAASLGNLLVRVPFRSSDALVAFVGLDPRPNDSGEHAGVRHLTKRGPSELRRLLYLVGSSAARCRMTRPLYERLRTRRSTTEAIVILGRKLLRVAFAVYRSNQPFDAVKLLPTDAAMT
jgi:transposase